MRKFSLAQLEMLPTLSQGQADDLKVDLGHTRVWLSRITVGDGAQYDNEVTVEQYVLNDWTTVGTYQATDYTDYTDEEVLELTNNIEKEVD